MSWLEVSLVVDGEMAEAVAELLSRFTEDGVVIESTAIGYDPLEQLAKPIGQLRVSCYLPVTDALEEQRHKLEQALWYLGRIRSLPEPEFQIIEQANWADAWKVHYKPITIGQRLIITPTWIEPEVGDRIPIRIDPGMAFGTGTHPTTQLCLQVVEYLLSARSFTGRVIDLGCGSGILGIAALKLGASQALGVDIDEDAIASALENAHHNTVADRFMLHLGSLADIRGGAFEFQKAPLVLANILAPVLVRMLGDGLGELVEPGGYLVLSGILEEQVDKVERALVEQGLYIQDRLQQGDWVAIVAQNKSGKIVT